MRLGAILGLLVGVALSAWLLSLYGAAAILGLVAHAGWGLVPAVLFHVVQLFVSGWAWACVTDARPARITLYDYVVLRWIREGVNNLLPVAQVGGPVIGTRLLWRRGVPLTQAVAGTLGDLTVEVITQIAFTLLALALLLGLVGGGAGVARAVGAGVLTAAVMAAGLVAAQNLGLARLVEAGLARFGGATGLSGLDQISGLHQALTALYRAPRRLGSAMAWHMVGWLLGGVEICLFMHVLGHDVGIGPGLVIESLSQALKAAGFAVPGALGVQEGGFIVVCGLFHITPELAVALSLVKRLREVVISLPSLWVWQREEAK